MSTPFDTATIVIPSGPDENPLSDGGNWVSVSGPPLKRVAGKIEVDASGTYGEMRWTPDVFADGSIAWVFRDNPALNHMIVIRARAAADLTSYVLFQFNPAGPNVYIATFAGGTTTTVAISSTVPGLTVGDRLGAAFEADQLSFWHQACASVGVPAAITDNWTEMVSGTSTAVLDPGYTTLGLGALECSVDSEAMGVVVPGGGGGDGSTGKGRYSKILFGDGMSVVDEGEGVIRVSAGGGGGGGGFDWADV